MANALRLGLASLTLALLAGCASLGGITPDQAFTKPPPALELRDVPYFPQDAYQCGPAALAEMLGWSGAHVTPEALEPALFIPERKGSLQTEIIAQTRQNDRIPYQIPKDFNAIIQELEAGNPVMVFQNLSLSWWPLWHYAVIVGYDPDRSGFILRSGTEKRVFLSLDRFRRTWDRGDRWAIVITSAERLPASAKPLNWLQAAMDLEHTGKQDIAIIALEAGREQWPEQTGFHLGLVNAQYAAGKLNAAEAAARRGIEQSASNPGVLYNNLATILGEQSRWDEAETAAQAAISSGGRFLEDFQKTLERIQCGSNQNCRERDGKR